MVQPLHTRGFLQQARLRWISNWRVATALWVGVLLALASGYTTLMGVLSFTAPSVNERSILAVVLALFISIAIQVAMLLSCWAVGNGFVRAIAPHLGIAARARHFGPAVLWLLIFAATLCLSVFFSYDTFYKSIAQYASDPSADFSRPSMSAVSDPAARGNRSLYINSLAETYVRQRVDASLVDIRRAAEDRRQAFFEALTRPPEQLSDAARHALSQAASLASAVSSWREYRGQMREIVTLARDAREPIRATAEAIERDEKLQAGKEAARLSTREEAAAAKKKAEEESARLEEQIKKANTEIDDLKSKIGGFEDRERDATKRMNCEEFGRECPDGWHAQPGKRQRFWAAKTDFDDASNLKKQFKGDLDAKTKELAGLQGSLKEQTGKKAEAEQALAENADIGDATGAARSAATRIRTLKDLDVEADALDRTLLAANSPAIFRSTKPAGALPNATAAASDDKAASLDDLGEHCRRILDYLAGPAFADVSYKNSTLSVAADARGRKSSCSNEGVSAAQALMTRINDGLREFDQAACERLGKDYRNGNTSTMIRRGEECLEYVSLDADAAEDFANSFAELRREHNGPVHPFVQSMNGLRTYHDKLAYLSLGIAAMIDLLVFFIGIAGGAETLRRVDRIGGELRGDEVRNLQLAAATRERASDSEAIRLCRHVLHRLVPMEYAPDPHDRPHVRYIGYIAQDDLQRGVEEDDSILREILIWMSVAKAGTHLVIRLPRPEDKPAPPPTGMIEPDFEAAELPTRFFFLQELVLDIAEDIVHWDKAHARASAIDAGPASADGGRRDRAARGSGSIWLREKPFWVWSSTRDPFTASASAGAEAPARRAGASPTARE